MSTLDSPRGTTFLNRPQAAPMGPRTRKSRSNLLVDSLLDTPRNLSSTLDLHEFGGAWSRPPTFTPSPSSSLPSAPSTPSTPSTPSFSSGRMSIPAALKEPETPLDSVPAYEEEETLHIYHNESAKVAPVNVVAQAPPRLVPPTGIKFESTPVPWKAFPLEAALWMLDSNELQNIVARAIQSSESFVRLLTLENINNVLPAELERLNTLKAVTQSKYRFLVHRRTMLFQALNSSLSHKNSDSTVVIGGLASQLADTITECEKLSEELLSISDQMAQINKLIDIHLGSAFAVALRKLNGSLTRRVAEVTEAKERIAQLEIDVHEAWKEAEKLAKELDDYETDLIADDTEAIIEVAEIVPIQPSSPSHSRRPSTPTLLSIAPSINPSTSPMAHMESQLAFPPAVVHLTEKEDEEDVPDTVSIRSSHSTRSTKSLRARGDRTSSILAAKRRSHRVSQSSLRLTRHSRKQSSIRFKPAQEEHPVPELPLHFTDNVIPTMTPYASSTLLHLDSHTPSLRRQGSLDSVYRSPVTSTAASAFRGRCADDIYVRPYNPSSSSEIQLVSRPQTCNFTTPDYERSVFETDTDVPSKIDAVAAPTSKSIPSMWMNVDALKTPLSRSGRPASEGERTNSMKTTYSKFKTLTKRYSATLPIFTQRSSPPTKPRPKSDY